jgi:hypothetical protein
MVGILKNFLLCSSMLLGSVHILIYLLIYSGLLGILNIDIVLLLWSFYNLKSTYVHGLTNLKDKVDFCLHAFLFFYHTYFLKTHLEKVSTQFQNILEKVGSFSKNQIKILTVFSFLIVLGLNVLVFYAVKYALARIHVL